MDDSAVFYCYVSFLDSWSRYRLGCVNKKLRALVYSPGVEILAFREYLFLYHGNLPLSPPLTAPSFCHSHDAPQKDDRGKIKSWLLFTLTCLKQNITQSELICETKWHVPGIPVSVNEWVTQHETRSSSKDQFDLSLISLQALEHALPRPANLPALTDFSLCNSQFELSLPSSAICDCDVYGDMGSFLFADDSVHVVSSLDSILEPKRPTDREAAFAMRSALAVLDFLVSCNSITEFLDPSVSPSPMEFLEAINEKITLQSTEEPEQVCTWAEVLSTSFSVTSATDFWNQITLCNLEGQIVSQLKPPDRFRFATTLFHSFRSNLLNTVYQRLLSLKPVPWRQILRLDYPVTSQSSKQPCSAGGYLEARLLPDGMPRKPSAEPDPGAEAFLYIGAEKTLYISRG